MILIIGGASAGKMTYLRSLGYSEAEISRGELDERPALYGLEALVRRDPAAAEALYPRLVEKEAVVCQEVGLGVVPLDPEDRAYREAVGRLCIRLAARADRVVRLVCGVPQIIKDETTDPARQP